jgi:hypothetical protein
MDKEAMVDIALKSVHYQDSDEVEKQLALFAEHCTFKMPTNKVPMQGLDELRKSVAACPKAETRAEWFNPEGNRQVICWNRRSVGDRWPKNAPLLRGISVFEFNDAGLIERYEDSFDPDWMTRHAEARETAA